MSPDPPKTEGGVNVSLGSPETHRGTRLVAAARRYVAHRPSIYERTHAMWGKKSSLFTSYVLFFLCRSKSGFFPLELKKQADLVGNIALCS